MLSFFHVFVVHPRPNFLPSVPHSFIPLFFPFPPPVLSSSLIFPLFPFLPPVVLLVYFILLHFHYVSPRYQYYKLIIFLSLFPFITYCHFFHLFFFSPDLSQNFLTFAFIPWRRKWQPTLVPLPGKSHGQRSLVGYSPQGRRVGHD